MIDLEVHFLKLRLLSSLTFFSKKNIDFFLFSDCKIKKKFKKIRK